MGTNEAKGAKGAKRAKRVKGGKRAKGSKDQKDQKEKKDQKDQKEEQKEPNIPKKLIFQAFIEMKYDKKNVKDILGLYLNTLKSLNLPNNN